MSEDFTKELRGATAFEKRVLAEFASLRGEIGEVRGGFAELRSEVAELRSEVAEIRIQQTAMAKNIAVLDQRLTSLEERVDVRLKETRPIWEAVRAQIEKLDEKFNCSFAIFTKFAWTSQATVNDSTFLNVAFLLKSLVLAIIFRCSDC
jgi:predicted  nucleic acid-binding Zn-ribbon protein